MIQATRKVEPHFVRGGLRKVEAGPFGALEGRPSVRSVDRGAKSIGSGQKQQREGARGAAVGALLEEPVFDVRMRIRLAVADTKYDVDGERKRILGEGGAMQDVPFERRCRNQGSRVPGIVGGERGWVLQQIASSVQVGCEFIGSDGLGTLFPGLDVVADDQTSRLEGSFQVLGAGLQNLDGVLRRRGLNVQAVVSLTDLVRVAIEAACPVTDQRYLLFYGVAEVTAELRGFVVAR